MVLICKHCGKEFKTTHSCAVYCSRSCRNKANPIKYTKERRKAHSKACKGINVGKDNAAYGKFGEDSPSFGTRRTEECRKRMSELRIGLYEGKNNPNWKGGISDYPYPEEWTEELKTKIRKRDLFVCQLCGLTGWHIHHIDYDKDNCLENNLITLCHSCHSKTNFNREVWKKYFEEFEEVFNV